MNSLFQKSNFPRFFVWMCESKVIPMSNFLTLLFSSISTHALAVARCFSKAFRFSPFRSYLLLLYGEVEMLHCWKKGYRMQSTRRAVLLYYKEGIHRRWLILVAQCARFQTVSTSVLSHLLLLQCCIQTNVAIGTNANAWNACCRKLFGLCLSSSLYEWCTARNPPL